MIIAFDAKRAYLNNSGLGNYSRTLITQLCRYYPDNKYWLYSPGIDKSHSGFPPGNSDTFLPPVYFPSLLHSYWRSFSLGRILKKRKPDIYHGLSNELPMNIHQSGIKSIVTIHDLIFRRFPELYKKPDRAIYDRKFRYAAKNADLIIAASDQTRKDIIRYYEISESKIQVVYQSGNPIFSKSIERKGLEAIRKKYDLPVDYIFYLGTIEERKNLLQLIKALSHLKIDMPLVIAGRPKKEYFQKITDFISKNRINGIHFLRNVPTPDLPALYQMAKLFVYPSSFEGFGIPVLEAIQSGIPVIAGKGHCLEETGGPGSIYIDPMDTEEFATAILNVVQDSELQSKMIKSGKKHALKFLPEVTSKNLMSCYESIQ